MPAQRICFIGDSLVQGVGDDRALGWPGRLVRLARDHGHDVTGYNLGIRGETSRDIARRWRSESDCRLDGNVPGALVFSFGCNDMSEDGGCLRVTVEDSLSIAREMMEEAASWLPTLWLGLLPINDGKMPFSAFPGRERVFSSSRNRALSEAYGLVADAIGVPYLDLFSQATQDEGWRVAISASDGVHPLSPGYDFVARKFDAWAPWRAMLELSSDNFIAQTTLLAQAPPRS
ncbi:GDSL-type esterase/lipase family protein [Sedimentitalea sp.]|uniref:GDSL-type esterase/lipase family protein n=1 Tax=Sedimentitalea sp. TaxID=2048915 RepID=UPI003296F46E